MKKALLMLLLWAPAARAEFSSTEKTQVTRMQQIVFNARYLEFYAGEELRLNGDPAAWPKCIALGLAAHRMEDEAHQAIDNLIGSLAQNIPSNRPREKTLQRDHRVASAQFFWSRAVGGYRNGQARAALDALRPLAVTNGITIFADRLFASHFDVAYGQVDLTLSFEAREPNWYPFLVRRAADGIGVHGHFEQATSIIAEGQNYVADGSYFAWLGLRAWEGELTQEVRSSMRNLTLGHRDTLKAIGNVQRAAFGIGPDAVGPNDFARLFATTESALVDAGSGLRGQFMFALRGILRAAMASGQAAAAEQLAEAVEKVADGWGHVDSWTWHATRFPCIEGFDSVGCRPESEGGLGLPPEPLFP